MARPESRIAMRIVIEDPVVGVALSLQSKTGEPVDPKTSRCGEPLAFDFTIQLTGDGRLLGDQVRREGAARRFVYIGVGKHAGDRDSAWDRRMKIDIHDLDRALLEVAAGSGRRIEIIVPGTGRDGSPACATVLARTRRLSETDLIDGSESALD